MRYGVFRGLTIGERICSKNDKHNVWVITYNIYSQKKWLNNKSGETRNMIISVIFYPIPKEGECMVWWWHGCYKTGPSLIMYVNTMHWWLIVCQEIFHSISIDLLLHYIFQWLSNYSWWKLGQYLGIQGMITITMMILLLIVSNFNW